MLSKLGVLAERGIKKSKKNHAIAPAALWRSGPALGGSGGALGSNIGSNVGSNVGSNIGSRKYARAFVEICDVMFCAQKPRTCKKYPTCIQKKCKCIV